MSQSAVRYLPSATCRAEATRRRVRRPQLDAAFGGTINHQPSTINRQSGVALIVTLILLAVTLVMAIAFLALSRRERASASTETQYITAKYAADAALNHAEAQIVSQMLGATNPYISGLLVSTNYINGLGFTSGSANPTNVNYDHYLNSAAPLNQADFQQNIANLFYYPRPPVVYGSSSNTDSRFYLDLNRNGRYDTNGWVTNFDNNLNGLGYTSFQVGDPEWIGILEHPDAPHGPNNPFIARYCFIAVPANSLDANYNHNQVLGYNQTTVNKPVSGFDEYSRNQGIGTWELNLAAFLADLNTNRWDPPTLWNSSPESYSYPQAAVGDSAAFDDARALVAWRYTNSFSSLASADSLFGFGLPANNPFLNNGMDTYGVGSQTTFDTNYFNYYNANNFPNKPWAGAQYNNSYFNIPSDLFNTNKANYNSAPVPFGYSQFATNLYAAGTSNSTYDRYTFYRLLGQLGTDTSPASGKINLNYSNAIVNYDPIATNFATSITIVPNAETSFMPWRPRDFFTVAANQMLHAYTAAWFEDGPSGQSNYLYTYYGVLTNFVGLSGIGLTNVPLWGMTNEIPAFGITNIPVLVNGQFVYSPAVNRILQLAANIYDASTNLADSGVIGMSNYPSVFRPVFWVTNEYNPNHVLQTDVYIKGYEYVPEPLHSTDPARFMPPIEVNDPSIMNLAASFGGGVSYSNVWGVPWIIGAKKGFPNFNGLEVDNTFFIERLLQFNRNTATPDNTPGDPFPYGRTYWTNQMYVMGISNVFAIEHWNSYANTYINPLSIVVQYNLGFALSNNAPGYVQINNPYMTNNSQSPFVTNDWPGYSSSYNNSFILPIGTNTVMQNLGLFPSPTSTNNVYMYLDNTGIGSTNIGGYAYTAPCFIPSSLNPQNYPNSGTPQLPHLVMMTTNRLWAYMIDTESSAGSYILDAVQLGGMNSSLDLNQAIADPDNSGMWSTNAYDPPGDTPYGVDEQYLVSYGDPFPGADNDAGSGGWSSTPIPGSGATGAAAQTTFFQSFFTKDDSYVYNGKTYQNTNTSIQAAYTPMRTVVQRFVYQANDPLVHDMTQDLYDFQDSTNGHYPLSAPPPTIGFLGRTSDRYMPWNNPGNLASGNLNGSQADGFNGFVDYHHILSYKDPLVWSSDNWDFPSYKYPTVGWLGRVHRGTPWQTVYLKSTNVWQIASVTGSGTIVPTGPATWMLWTGNVFNGYDAYNALPVWDRLLFDLFTATPDDDATRGQVSVNIGANTPTSDPSYVMAGLASWSALFSGTTAFSDPLSDSAFSGYHYQNYIGYQSPESIDIQEQWPIYTNSTIQPLGTPGTISNPLNPTNYPLYQIVQGINNTRATFTNIDGLSGVFEHVGDVLSTPQLSDFSPFLKSADATQQKYGISDEMYEWMPQQLLGLMTVSGTPQAPTRYVVYCYGQTLKPAPNGVVMSGQFVGMCTNYQVTAETAARAVIRVVNPPSPENPNANPGIVVEQFNPLPPD